jgi:hypothetical protein
VRDLGKVYAGNQINFKKKTRRQVIVIILVGEGLFWLVYEGIVDPYSNTAGCFTPPGDNLLQSLSTPCSTCGNGPIGVIAFGLISP